MCYDAASGTKLALKYAKHRGDDPALIEVLTKQLALVLHDMKAYYHVSGFAHPHLLVFTNEQPYTPRSFMWGLIPPWIKDEKSAAIISNQTLNARSESIFEKPSFRESAIHKRCLIYIDAFYEYHHVLKKTYPFHIAMKDQSPMIIAGLWSEWMNPTTGEIISTCAMVTTIANQTMAKIHNGPNISEPRMPVILSKENQDEWLKPIYNEDDKNQRVQLLQPLQDDLLACYTVRKLKGKDALGNTPEVENKVDYPELVNFI